MSEHRREARQRVFLKGRIVFNNGASTFDCLVREMSISGARLALSETATLPEAFDLYVPQKERTYRASLRWRSEDGVGVAIADAARGGAAAPAAPAVQDSPMAALLRRVAELEAENTALRRLLTGVAQPAAPAA